MAITVKHKFVSAIPDAGDTTIVQPSNWNDDHQLTGTVPVANGGTGASDAPTALTNLGAYPASNPSGYGTGTVTSVAASVPSFLSVTGSPITTSGTLALTYSGTALPVANGGTGVTTSSGANSVVLRDANGNITTNCLFEGFSTQAASVTTIVLTASSVQNWQITGSGGQTIKLPDATTLPNGATFTFNNNQSSGTIIVQNNSSTTVATINSGGYVTVVLLSNSTAAGSWDKHDSTPSNVSWSTNTLDYAGSITSATWNGNAVAVNRGGTGQTTYTDGQLLIGNSTGNTLTKSTLSAGTGISIANSAGGITITNTSPSSGGTVTSVTGTAPIASSGGNTPAISLAASYGDTQNPYASKTANYILAAPNGSAGAPTFRAIVAADIPTLNQNTTGSAATLTTPRNIYGNAFDGSAALTQVIASTYGGTGNGFTKFSGATTAEKTYTLPDANATLLYAGGALGTPSSGTVTNLTGTASININGTVGATTANTGAFTTLSATGVITSTLATGTAPFTVASTTQVANLNAATAGTAGNVTGIVLGANGGTGVANTGSTITVAGNLSHAGAFTQTFTATANTSLTLPTSGTLISTATNMAANPVTGTPSSSNYLRGDGTWATVTASPGGSTTQIQYNNAGALAGSANMTFDGTTITSSFSGAHNGTVGATTPASGAFTTLTANASVTASGNKGAISYGTLGYSDTNILASYQSSVAGYNQVILQNTSNNAAASTNFNISNDAGTATTNFGEFGINSSGFTGTGAFNAAGTAYLASASTDLAIGTYGSNAIHFVVNSGATDAATISSAGLLTANSFASSSAAITGGSINGTTIGASTASTIIATQLTVNGANLNTAISPTGTGTVTIAPAGATTLGTAGVATTMNGNISATTSNQTITLSPTGTGTVAISPVGALTINPTAASTINNASIGVTTPLAGSFTSLTATSVGTAGVLAKTGGKTAVTAISATTTLTTGGTTLASQVMASGSVWRVTAYGTFAAVSSATTRTFTMACFWGATQLTAITTGSVLTGAAQTTPWKVEFEITGSSATAAWVTGFLSAQVTSATIPLNYAATAASTTGLTTTSTLDIRFANGTSALDAINVQQVIIERIV